MVCSGVAQGKARCIPYGAAEFGKPWDRQLLQSGSGKAAASVSGRCIARPPALPPRVAAQLDLNIHLQKAPRSVRLRRGDYELLFTIPATDIGSAPSLRGAFGYQGLK